MYGKLIQEDQESLRKLVEDICGVLFSEQTTSSLVAEAFTPNSNNPFRHLRAEFFENQPELHAKTFALPDAIKVGALEDMKPCILEGSRGTGKSMLLLSLRARNFLLRSPTERGAPQRFGFYLKLTREWPSKAWSAEYLGQNREEVGQPGCCGNYDRSGTTGNSRLH